MSKNSLKACLLYLGSKSSSFTLLANRSTVALLDKSVKATVNSSAKCSHFTDQENKRKGVTQFVLKRRRIYIREHILVTCLYVLKRKLPCDPSVRVARVCQGNLWSPGIHEEALCLTCLGGFIDITDRGTKLRGLPVIQGIQLLRCFLLCPILPVWTFAH